MNGMSISLFHVVFCIQMVSRHHNRACLLSRSSGYVNLTNPTSDPPASDLTNLTVSRNESHVCQANHTEQYDLFRNEFWTAVCLT